MKKLFALLLALTMTFRFRGFQPVWAETVATEPTQTTQTPEETEETVPESTEPETTEPAVPAQTEAPETTAPETTEASEPESEEPRPDAEPSAEDVPVPQSDSTGVCGESLTWTLSGGTLPISGSGAMTDYGESNTAPWYSDREQITAVVVDRGVTGIGAYAFYGCVNLGDITLPEGLTAIGKYAFTGCSNLGRVEILSGMTTLGSSAFEESGVTEVVLPEGLKTIEYGAFASCANLRSVSLPSTLENLKSCAFWQCSALTAITLPQSIRNMEYNCFGRCSSLTEIEIPSQLTTIGANVFDGCTALKSVTMQEGLKVIGVSAFRGCEALSQIHLPESITELGESAFSGCKNLTTVNLPQGITKIPSNLFSGCGSLTAITIPDSVFTIGYSAFSGCSSLEAVEIPTGVSAIGSYAFSRCTSLTEMVIPEGVSQIGYETFYNCTSLRQVTLPSSLTEIGEQAFRDCASLQSVQLPDKLTSVGNYAFSGCTALERVDIPASVAAIGERAFSGCAKLTAITFGHRQENPLTIGVDAFNVGYYVDNVKTRIGVYSVRGIHPAIQGYAWEKRTVTYYNTETIPLEAIAIHAQNDAAEIEVGLPLTFVAELTPFDTTEDPVWSINPDNSTGTAEITAEGVLTGLTPGIVTVRAAAGSDESVYGETQISLLPPTGEPDSIGVRTTKGAVDEVQLGIPMQMQVVFQPGNVADKTVKWSVSDESIATIDENGVLTPLAIGSVTVYAESEAYGIEGSCVVKVLRYVEEITILRNGGTERNTLAVGEKLQLSFQFSPEDTTTKNVTWEVTEGTGQAKIVTYYYNHTLPELQGVAPGTVILTATAQDYPGVSASIELTVTDTAVSYALPDGSGNIYFDTETGTIIASDKDVKNVSIPAKINGVPVTAIAPYVFYDTNRAVTAVSIPKSVTEIGEGAFDSCLNMTSLRFASGSALKRIGAKAFRCNKVTTLTLPDGLESVGEDAFSCCESVTTLYIPDSVKSIGKWAFSSMSSLKKLTMPGEFDWIGIVDYGDGLETAVLTGTYVVRTPQAKNVILADTVTEVRDGAFENGHRVENITLSRNLKRIGDRAFKNCHVRNIMLPDGIEYIGEKAFESCRSLESINLPDSIQFIGKDAFHTYTVLNLFELNDIPDTIAETVFLLKPQKNIPSTLIRATGGQTVFDWGLSQVDGEKNTSEIAFISRKYDRNDNYQTYVVTRSAGRIYVVYEDSYTGVRCGKIVEVKYGLVIRPSDVGYLTGGQSLQLSAYMMPENTAAQVTWSLGAGDEAYASLSQTGLLKVSSGVNGTRQITVLQGQPGGLAGLQRSGVSGQGQPPV